MAVFAVSIMAQSSKKPGEIKTVLEILSAESGDEARGVGYRLAGRLLPGSQGWFNYNVTLAEISQEVLQETVGKARTEEEIKRNRF